MLHLMKNSRHAGFGFGPLHAAKLGVWNPGLYTDPNVIAVYDFEPAHPLKDKKGSNDLEIYERTQLGNDTKASDGSAQFVNLLNTRLLIPDASLANGTPWKSNQATMEGSACVWLKAGPFPPASCPIWAKWGPSGTWSIALWADFMANLYLRIGFNGGTLREDSNAVAVGWGVNRWYFIGATLDGSGNYRIRVYDQTGDVTTQVTGTFTNAPELHNAAWSVGGDTEAVPWYLNTGIFSFFSLWDRALTAAEIDNVRLGVLNPMTDPDCISLWLWSSGNFWADAKAANNWAAAVPAVDLVNKKVGNGAIDLERDTVQSLGRSDARLQAAWPGKSGDVNFSYTFTCWVQQESLDAVGYRPVWSKGATIWNVGHHMFLHSDQIIFTTRFTGGNASEAYNAALTAMRWYFIGCVYDESVGKQRFYVWDDVLGELQASESINDLRVLLGAVQADASPFRVGSSDAFNDFANTFDGRIDELVVFDKPLTFDQIRRVRQGKY